MNNINAVFCTHQIENRLLKRKNMLHSKISYGSDYINQYYKTRGVYRLYNICSKHLSVEYIKYNLPEKQ